MTDQAKPTLGAQHRFENLSGMFPTKVTFSPGTGEGAGEEHSVSGTAVDISPGCMSIRVPLEESDAATMEKAAEGDFVEACVSQSEDKQWTVLGHLAWIWVPTMEGDDRVGSLGVNIAGVIESGQGFVGTLRRVVGLERPVEVDRSPKRIETPAERRQRKLDEAKAAAAAAKRKKTDSEPAESDRSPRPEEDED